jgi:hypothetical protein
MHIATKMPVSINLISWHSGTGEYVIAIQLVKKPTDAQIADVRRDVKEIRRTVSMP